MQLRFMNIRYDKIADALYMKISEGVVEKTIPVDERILADVDKDGNTLGIEMLEVSRQFPARGTESLSQQLLRGIPVQVISEGSLLAV